MFEEQLAHHRLEVLPEPNREPARAALGTVLDAGTAISVRTVVGGASGALVHRVDADGHGPLVLRIETARDSFRNPHRTYACLRTAADAGIAPAVHLADPAAGIVVMDFVEHQPITDHRGGPEGVVRELGELVRRLHATPAWPPLHHDFAGLLDQMLATIEGGGLFADRVLDPVRLELRRIVETYPWQRHPQVSSHNDINPYNVLFDGQRLWLIDWETAFSNDPLADVACVANNFADPSMFPDTWRTMEDALLRAWLGHEPDLATRSRLTLMRQLNRLFYGCLMLSAPLGVTTSRPPEATLDALTIDEFREAVGSGRLVLGGPELLHEMGKMQLAAFLDGSEAPGFAEALVHAAM